MIKRVVVTISVVGGVMLAIALAPNVPTAELCGKLGDEIDQAAW